MWSRKGHNPNWVRSLSGPFYGDVGFRWPLMESSLTIREGFLNAWFLKDYWMIPEDSFGNPQGILEESAKIHPRVLRESWTPWGVLRRISQPWGFLPEPCRNPEGVLKICIFCGDILKCLNAPLGYVLRCSNIIRWHFNAFVPLPVGRILLSIFELQFSLFFVTREGVKPLPSGPDVFTALFPLSIS